MARMRPAQPDSALTKVTNQKGTDLAIRPRDLRRLGWAYPSGSQKTDKISQAGIPELEQPDNCQNVAVAVQRTNA